MKTEKAIFAAGCFWGIQAAFDEVPGVVKTTVGYTGGHTKNPTYKDVCNDDTGHAEAVLVEFDPAKASYEDLLNVFWDIHDPTQFNKQGPDEGSQYRSEIFYYNENQKKIAENSLKKHQKKIGKTIATLIENAAEFYPAEEHHQKYYKKHKMVACVSNAIKRLTK